MVSDGVDGPVRAHATGGDVVLWLPEAPDADVRVNAADGNVFVMLDRDVPVQLETMGEVQSSHGIAWGDEVVDESGERWASTTFNGGGQTVRASSLTGTVSVRQMTPEEQASVDHVFTRRRDEARGNGGAGGDGGGARGGGR